VVTILIYYNQYTFMLVGDISLNQCGILILYKITYVLKIITRHMDVRDIRFSNGCF
jgi:hypothetical protein